MEAAMYPKVITIDFMISVLNNYTVKSQNGE